MIEAPLQRPTDSSAWMHDESSLRQTILDVDGGLALLIKADYREILHTLTRQRLYVLSRGVRLHGEPVDKLSPATIKVRIPIFLRHGSRPSPVYSWPTGSPTTTSGARRDTDKVRRRSSSHLSGTSMGEGAGRDVQRSLCFDHREEIP